MLKKEKQRASVTQRNIDVVSDYRNTELLARESKTRGAASNSDTDADFAYESDVVGERQSYSRDKSFGRINKLDQANQREEMSSEEVCF